MWYALHSSAAPCSETNRHKMTNERLELAREYNVTLHFSHETHFFNIWVDIDNAVFPVSHRWLSTLDQVSDDPPHSFGSKDCTKGVRAATYNIWNFNDQWERRAEMIVGNILEVSWCIREVALRLTVE